MIGLVVVFALAAGVLAGKEDLLTLTNETFYDAIDKYGKVFVKFFAPWCGHCKRLAPAWEELAGTVEGVQIAEMDCTVEAHEPICSKYEVTGFPTLVLIEKDGGSMRYEDAREVEDMRRWAVDMAGPASKVIGKDDKIKGKDVSFILLGAEEEDIENWSVAMAPYKGKYGIFHIFGNEYMDNKAEKKSILILKKLEEPILIEYKAEEIRNIIEANKRLLVNELGPRNFSAIASDTEHAMWITFVRNTHDQEFETQYNKIKEAAKKCGETVNFCYINAVNFDGFTKNFGEMKDVPFSIILKPNDYLFYQYPEEQEVCEFIKEFNEGKIEPIDIRKRNKEAKEEKEEN